MSYDAEYFCPHCGAILNEQYGFDPDNGMWTCTCCGQELYGDDIYEGDEYPGVMWYCDNCGALLNKQSGFSDDCGSWFCTECGHLNSISEDEIYESKAEYEEKKRSSYWDTSDDDDEDEDEDDDDDDDEYDDDDDDEDDDEDDDDDDEYDDDDEDEDEDDEDNDSDDGDNLAGSYYDQSSLGNYGAPSFGGTSHPYRHSRSFHGSSTFFVRFCGILCFLALLAGGLYLAAKSIWGLFENGIGTTVFYLFTGCFLIWGAHLMRVSTFDADDFEELGVEGGSIFVDLAMKICGLALLTIRLPVFQDLSLLLRLAIGISLIVGSHFARKAISRNY